MSSRPRSPDWRNRADYVPLLGLERPAFAWEWLRRDERYRQAAWSALGARGLRSASGTVADRRAARWGLHAFEDPDLPAPEARPVWRREVHPFVLAAEALPPGAAGDRFSLIALRPLATLVREGEGDGAGRLLLSDGRSSLRMDIERGGLGNAPVTLRYRLEGFESAQAPLLTLRRLVDLVRTGHFARALHPPDVRAPRWVALLRTTDALIAGARQREIAEHLLGREAADPRWRIEAPTLRSRAQRLVRQARALAAGGYLELLR